MNLLINKLRLDKLLAEKHDFIGGNLIADAGFAISAFSVTQGSQYGSFIWCMSCICCLYGLYLFGKHAYYRYDHKKLGEDIAKLDEIPHKFSLLVVRDTYNQYPNNFLLKYDERWECFLLPYFKTGNSTENIIQGIKGYLKTDIDQSSLTLKFEKTYEKFSVSSQKNKTYRHSVFYLPNLNFQEIHKQKEFTIEGNKFKWFTLDEMRNNKDIMSKNDDVVDILSKIVF